MTFVHRYRHCTGSLFRRMFFSPTFPLCPSYVFILSPRKYPNISNISKNIQYFQLFQYPNISNIPTVAILYYVFIPPPSKAQCQAVEPKRPRLTVNTFQITFGVNTTKWNPWRPNPPKNVNGELCHLDHSTVGLTVEEEGSQESPKSKNPHKSLKS